MPGKHHDMSKSDVSAHDVGLCLGYGECPACDAEREARERRELMRHIGEGVQAFNNDLAYRTEVCTCGDARRGHNDSLAPGHGSCRNIVCATKCQRYTWDGKSGPYAVHEAALDDDLNESGTDDERG